ncbi:alpha-(1,3)-fucosyltransferase 4-like [Halichoeres trimaculatus]|uniref:alpha-(1,3)-fucosyltransferase 4-like n=1 Tax=Halichoeres trimaculatus TaxID=147232 RepID=UPI003D9F2A59
MGAGAHRGAASSSTVSAHTADRSKKCCDSVFRRIVFSAVLAATVFLGVCFLYLPDLFDLSGPFGPLAETGEVTVLVWAQPFGRRNKLPDCRALYQVEGCTLTDDQRAYPKADAVIMHHREVGSGVVKLPSKKRPAKQKWIWMNFESPTHSPGLSSLNGLFNLTMSYRKDSDIFLPYGCLVPNNLSALWNHYPYPLRALAPTSQLLRPLLLAWVVSNWSGSHARVVFYNTLRQYITVDLFGRAGKPLPNDIGNESVLRLLEQYQFYLSLENSKHTDYITEKLWNAILAGSIPVVLGPSRQNYERFLPPEAFIHVDDFPTVRELAEYLQMLRREPVRLRKHLDWRGNYSVHRISFWDEQYCMACKTVMKKRGRTQVVRDLNTWFSS